MNACARFEEEGLYAVESGQDLDSHYDECPDCRTARAEYGRMGGAIAAAGADDRPAGDWQARVWAEIRRGQAVRRRRTLWTLLPVGLAAALTAAVLLQPRTPTAPVLTAAVEPGDGPVRRGGEAHPGDRLVLEAQAGGLEFAELRVYLNARELVLRCADEPPCERDGDRLRARVTFDAIGTYQPLLVAGDRPPPAPGEGLDADAAAAMRAGFAVELPQAIQVR